MRRLDLRAPRRPSKTRSGRTRGQGQGQGRGRRSPPRFGGPRARRNGTVALSLALLATLGWLWHSGWFGRQFEAAVTAAYDASAGFGFAVDDVLVEGRVRSDSGAILKALGVERGTPILSIDPAAAQARLEALPWVSRAAVERRLPRIVYLRLTERRPMALWQLDGEISVIDQNGAVIPGVQSSRFAELPLVVGEGAAAHAAALLAMLDREPEFKPLVMAAVRVGSRRWNLRLRGGIDVRLPETEAAAAWAQFAKLEREHGLLARDVIAIDLRLPDRLVVRMAPDAKLGDEADAGRNT
jgi:cell division protein FtsQ